MTQPPLVDIDIYDEANLMEPYEAYRQMRAAGPVVRLPMDNVYAVPRYSSARAVLGNWADYTSRFGVSVLSDKSPAALLFSDPPEHDLLRNIASRPVKPRALNVLEDRLAQEARAIVAEIPNGEPVEAVTAVAQRLPVAIISECVGLPEEARARMLDWASAGFNMAGPDNELRRNSIASAEEARGYVRSKLHAGNVKPDSWGAALFAAVENGELPPHYMPGLMMDYVGPSLDTTITGLANAIWCFATYPDQWQLLRDQPELLDSAISEVLRFQSPVLAFGRMTTREVEIEGVVIPSDARLMVLYASANRDEAEWGDPDVFRIERKPNHHLAFGFGIHSCMGMHLARLEMRLVLTALLARFERIELVSTERQPNNALRAFSALRVRFHEPAGDHAAG